MVGELETQLFCNGFLPRLDLFIVKFFYSTAFHTNNVVVMIIGGKLKDRESAFEMMSYDKPCGLKLRQNTVHCRQPDLFTLGQQHFVNILSADVVHF